MKTSIINLEANSSVFLGRKIRSKNKRDGGCFEIANNFFGNHDFISVFVLGLDKTKLFGMERDLVSILVRKLRGIDSQRDFTSTSKGKMLQISRQS